MRNIFEKLGLKVYGDGTKFIIKFSFHRDIYEKIKESDRIRLAKCACRDLLELKQGNFENIF